MLFDLSFSWGDGGGCWGGAHFVKNPLKIRQTVCFVHATRAKTFRVKLGFLWFAKLFSLFIYSCFQRRYPAPGVL